MALSIGLDVLWQGLVQPFIEFSFMRRALVAVLALSLGAAPLGCLLMLRRMSLMGDAMAHALLPGAAVGYWIAGMSVTAMSVGGFVAALSVALLAGAVTRRTGQREDASFAAFYLIALALGVLLISTHGSSVDLIHVLFGSVLAVDDVALKLVASIASVTLLVLALLYRALVVESFDPQFLQSVGGPRALSHSVLLVLTVANLVGGFQAMGTLMAVGLMMVPPIAARFWVRDLEHLWSLAIGMAMLSGVVGLLLSFHADWPSGPAIVLVAGGLYVVSLLWGPHEGLLRAKGV